MANCNACRKGIEGAETSELANMHRELDAKIEESEGQGTVDGMDIPDAKMFKCRIRTELGMRVKSGDADAVAYAEEREW